MKMMSNKEKRVKNAEKTKKVAEAIKRNKLVVSCS